VLILIVNKTITSLPCQRSVRGNRQADRPVCYGVVVTNGSIYPPFHSQELQLFSEWFTQGSYNNRLHNYHSKHSKHSQYR